MLCVFVRASHIFIFVLFYPPSLFLFFFFLEFINGVFGLRWMSCEGAVAYYVECTNVVKKWYGSDCVNRGCQGHRGWDFRLATCTLDLMYRILSVM